jgi:2-polyprenyl-3-methyl-5-hydroxy-6-metoxy-1,4-benzoquinol methylase
MTAPGRAGEPAPLSPEEQVTSELWGRQARRMSEDDAWQRSYWQSHPVTARHINRLISGNEAEGWLAFTKRRFLPEGANHGLSLGCGHGWTEREAIRLGVCRTFDALDISEEALEVARRQAADEGLQGLVLYRQADLNAVELERDLYDVVIAAQVIHHVDALEHLLDQVAASLAPGGLFVVNEYIGPARFQLLDKAQELMSRMLELLPRELKVNPSDGVVMERIERAAPEAIARVDPSESIRSDEIVELLTSRFEIVYRADFGGTLLQFLLADIAANFREDDAKDVALLDLMSLFEEVLIAERVVPSDFAFFVLSERS